MGILFSSSFFGLIFLAELFYTLGFQNLFSITSNISRPYSFMMHRWIFLLQHHHGRTKICPLSRVVGKRYKAEMTHQVPHRTPRCPETSWANLNWVLPQQMWTWSVYKVWFIDFGTSPPCARTHMHHKYLAADSGRISTLPKLHSRAIHWTTATA